MPFRPCHNETINSTLVMEQQSLCTSPGFGVLGHLCNSVELSVDPRVIEENGKGVRWRKSFCVCLYASSCICLCERGGDFAAHSVCCQVWLCELTLIIVFIAHSHSHCQGPIFLLQHCTIQSSFHVSLAIDNNPICKSDSVFTPAKEF